MFRATQCPAGAGGEQSSSATAAPGTVGPLNTSKSFALAAAVVELCDVLFPWDRVPTPGAALVPPLEGNLLLQGCTWRKVGPQSQTWAGAVSGSLQPVPVFGSTPGSAPCWAGALQLY